MAGGSLWHTIRFANGSWQASFGLIEGQSAGGAPSYTDVADGSADTQALQVVGVGSDGKLWHTIRNANGSWQASFGLIESQSSGGPPSFSRVGCGGANSSLHVVGVGSDGKLWHTIRNPNGSWQASFGLIENQSSGGPASFRDVAAGSADGQAVQVVGVGSDGKLWHTIRNANGSWQASFGLIESQSAGGPPSFSRVACGGANGSLHVVGVGSDGKLWHTIRNSNGSWQASFGLIESQSSGGPPSFTDVAARSADGQALQVVGVGSDGKLWHTIRNAGGNWQSSFGLVESQSSGGPASFQYVGCGSAGGLQVVGVGASPCSRYLGLNEQHQQQTEWCWSATTVSISLFYNPASTWTQCTLVNQAFGQTTCCTNGGSAACNQGWWPNLSLPITGNLNSYTNTSEPLATVMSEIEGGRPISIAIWWYGGGGHNPAIDGYDNCDPAHPTIDIKDPWYGTTTQDFNSFPSTYNGGATWGNTYFTKA